MTRNDRKYALQLFLRVRGRVNLYGEGVQQFITRNLPESEMEEIYRNLRGEQG